MSEAPNTTNDSTALNAICPYFTMFPLEIPLRLIRRLASSGSVILDPFCGRGTTNFAARLSGLCSVGIDVSPVAISIAEAKIASSTPENVLTEARKLLSQRSSDLPDGEFWDWAFHRQTLAELVSLRNGLLADSSTPARKILRAIILGALHGPITRYTHSHFSNQCTRTFAPKPAYAVKYWKTRQMQPRKVDTLALIERRASRYLGASPPEVSSAIFLGDSRNLSRLNIGKKWKFDLIITSPPYYGMRTYIPDQWLRNWFIGGRAEVEYAQPVGSVEHNTPSQFTDHLRSVWKESAQLSNPGARLVCRFGSISDRKVDPREVAKRSFADSGWRVTTIRDAGSAHDGRRQAFQFGKKTKADSKPEFDIYATLS